MGRPEGHRRKGCGQVEALGWPGWVETRRRDTFNTSVEVKHLSYVRVLL